MVSNWERHSCGWIILTTFSEFSWQSLIGKSRPMRVSIAGVLESLMDRSLLKQRLRANFRDDV